MILSFKGPGCVYVKSSKIMLTTIIFRKLQATRWTSTECIPAKNSTKITPCISKLKIEIRICTPTYTDQLSQNGRNETIEWIYLGRWPAFNKNYRRSTFSLTPHCVINISCSSGCLIYDFLHPKDRFRCVHYLRFMCFSYTPSQT